MPGFVIAPALPLMPEGLASLASEARRKGIRNVTTLVDRWVDGTERFDAPGGALLAATVLDDVVGVGGLSRCPDVPGALRVRRFYVAADWRRRGVARTLATDLITRAFTQVDTITCNARASSAAPPFWESLQFSPVDVEGITHIRHMG